MGKPKQRPRLSVGFAAEQQALKMIAETNPSSSTKFADINAAGWLKKVRVGKIVKAGKTGKKQNNLSHLNSAQIVEATSQIPTSYVPSKTSGILIPPTKLVDAQSLINSTRKQMKAQVRSKKARQLLKKEIFHKKVEVIKAEEKSKKEAKARQKTVIVGDLRPILDALPSVSSLDLDLQNLINQCHGAEVKQKTRRKLTMKRRNEEIAQGLNYFAAALSNK